MANTVPVCVLFHKLEKFSAFARKFQHRNARSTRVVSLWQKTQRKQSFTVPSFIDTLSWATLLRAGVGVSEQIPGRLR